ALIVCVSSVPSTNGYKGKGSAATMVETGTARRQEAVWFVHPTLSAMAAPDGTAAVPCVSPTASVTMFERWSWNSAWDPLSDIAPRNMPDARGDASWA